MVSLGFRGDNIPMELIQVKYNNFQAFVSARLPGNAMVSLFMQVPLGTFLNTCYEHYKLRTPKKKIVESIFGKMGIQQKDFDPEDLARFKRYISYFLDASKIIGQVN
jgi:hypothetical protein